MQIKNHNSFTFRLPNQSTILITSDFDSGNLQTARFINQQQIQCIPAFDCINHETSLKPSSKTFFNFSVQCSQNMNLKFRIKRMQILKPLLQRQQRDQHNYYICFKTQRQQQYRRLNKKVILYQINQNIEIWFNYEFKKKQIVYFAFSYPYSYKKLIDYLNYIEKKVQKIPQIFYHKRILCHSIEKRQIPYIYITNFTTQIKTQFLKQQKNNIQNPKKLEEYQKLFKKPIIIITSRVHPGESPSSYAMQAILQLLTHQYDYRSQILRNNFSFILIPMLNPDGVYHGLYRMDTLGQNLNRFYSNPQSLKQPGAYALKQLLKEHSNEKKIYMLFDLHSHANLKQFYMYGNSHDDIMTHVQSKVFGKLMEINCKNFDYQLCNYSKHQMGAKDSNQIMSKQGCARVVGFKTCNLIYSYTIQLGLHLIKKSYQMMNQNNKDLNFGEKRYFDYQNKQQSLQYLTDLHYKEAGRSILFCILDLYELNPYSRLKQKSIDKIRENITKQLCEQEKWLSVKLFEPKKIKNMSEIIKKQIINPFLQKYCIDKVYAKQIKQQKTQILNKLKKITKGHKMFKSQSKQNQQKNHIKLKRSTQIQEILKKKSFTPLQSKDQIFKLIQSRSPQTSKSNSKQQKQLVLSGQYSNSSHLIKQTNIQFNPFPILDRSKLRNFVHQNNILAEQIRAGKIIQKINLPALFKDSLKFTKKNQIQHVIQTSNLQLNLSLPKSRKNSYIELNIPKNYRYIKIKSSRIIQQNTQN